MERQPALIGVPDSSSVSWRDLSCTERLSWSMAPLLCLHGDKMLETAVFLLKNDTGLSSAGEIPPNATFWGKGITGILVPGDVTVGNRRGDPKE